MNYINEMIIIGITGTIGAGKGTIVDYLVKNKGFKHFSVRDYISEEIKRRNMPLNRDSMVLVANDLREKNSPSFIVDELCKLAQLSGQNCIIESIRTPGEVESMRKHKQFILFAVDAEPKLRYDRILLRGSETDHISYETFLENEAREMNSSDPNKQNLKTCISKADYLFLNNDDIASLNTKIEQVLTKL